MADISLWDALCLGQQRSVLEMQGTAVIGLFMVGAPHVEIAYQNHGPVSSNGIEAVAYEFAGLFARL